jgi:triosephosphate isomerase
LIDLFSLDSIAKQIRVIYGGSVDAENLIEYTGIPTMHGALVGTASVSAEKFLNLISKL